MKRIALILSVFLLLACFSVAPIWAAESVKIGAAFPLSGSIAVYGEGFKKCVDLAVEEINAKGGINGKNIEIVYEDNKSNAKDCVSAVRKLITVDKVPVLFGPAGSSNFMAAAPVAQESKVVMLSAQGTAEKLTQAGNYIFRIIASNSKQGQRLAKLAFDLGYRKLPVMYINNDWGLDLKDGFVTSFKKMGGVVTDIIPFDEKKTDYRTELLRANKDNPTAIVNLTYINEGAVQFKQAYETGVKTQWFCGSAARAPKMIELAGKAAEGVMGTYPSVLQDTKEYKTFKAAYKKKYGDDKIPIFGDYNYDMVYLTVKAVEKGGYTAEGIRTALLAVSKGYKGVTGDKTFDENRGMENSDIGIWIVKGGKIEDYSK